ncbi:transglutaminase domain-containing protein [Tenacibaculum ovolyticum]|uniref:transglutaminase domain-containing protein n=1 Tax=Tenacibaculum ovolyticum TaxID=104270 RepID=UPI001F2C064D|nr:transglutaminase domain-containing protein [Tenacibaculum ovolyticum]
MRNSIFFLLVFYFNLTNAQVSDFKEIDFTRADNIAKINKGESLKNLPLLCYKLTHKLTTEVEKFRAIYTWVSMNVKGDSKMHNRVSKMRKKLKKDSISLFKWNREYKKTVFKNLVKRKKTMCTGYAYLIKEMANIIDIDCKIIDGYGRTSSSNVETLEAPNHSWNAVKINNKWYLCDATWSSGYMNEYDSFITDYNTGYFLTEPVLFSKNHFPSNKKWLLKSTQTSTHFVNSPIIYGEMFKHKIKIVAPKKMKLTTVKKGVINFKLNSLEKISLKEISLICYLGEKEQKLKIFDLKKEQHKVAFKHKFKWKGHYDIHVKINNDIIASYTVKVDK